MMRPNRLSLLIVSCLAFSSGGCGGTANDSTGGGGGSDAGGGGGGTTTYSGTFSGSARGLITGTITVSGTSRTVALYVPTSVVSTPSLVIALHGTGGEAASFIDELGLSSIADSQQFVIAAPQALDRQGSSSDPDHSNPDEFGVWWDITSTTTGSNADLALIDAIILEAERAYNVDPNRIYLIGHSNGAFFTYLAAMALGNEVAAFAESSGGLITCTNREACFSGGSAVMGSGMSCAALEGEGGCPCSGSERPIIFPTSGHIPHGYLSHNNDDDTVPVYFTCSLASKLGSRGSTTIVTGGGHSIPSGFAQSAWNFMSLFTLSD